MQQCVNRRQCSRPLAAGKEPELSLKINLLAGATNMVFDYLFVAVLPARGLRTGRRTPPMSQVVGGVVPASTFARKNDNLLPYLHLELHGRVLFENDAPTAKARLKW